VVNLKWEHVQNRGIYFSRLEKRHDIRSDKGMSTKNNAEDVLIHTGAGVQEKIITFIEPKYIF
jgi:hypothetical protein